MLNYDPIQFFKGYLDCPLCPNLLGFTLGKTDFINFPKSAVLSGFRLCVSQYNLQTNIGQCFSYSNVKQQYNLKTNIGQCFSYSNVKQQYNLKTNIGQCFSYSNVKIN
jgi:hypothetical protein